MNSRMAARYEAPALVEALIHIRDGVDWVQCAERFTSSVMRLESLMLRAAVFEARDDGRSMRPVASQERGPGRYAISRDALRGVLLSGQAYCRKATPDGGLWCVAVPLLTGATAPLVVYGELTADGDGDAIRALARLSEFVRLVEPRFETLALLRGMDQWVLTMVKSLTVAVEAKDTYTCGHSERVSLYSDAVGRELGLAAHERQSLILGALCHDVGKIGIPDAVLKKPGLLNVDEIQEMQAHPLIGAGIINAASSSVDIAGAIKHHHERFDGTGYPDGLAGDSIPLFARVIAIVDAFDAMTSGRAYSGYVSQAAAVEALAAKDDLFDPSVIRAFVTAHDKDLLTMRTGTHVGNVGKAS